MADVIIVGAGPAGAVTGLLLARAGRDVLLLDSASFPRAKPCGDSLSAAATLVLDRLDLLDAVASESPARLDGWRITAPGGATVTGRFPDSSRGARRALAIPRERLDSVLVEAAVAAGARLRERVRVTELLRDAGGAVVGVRARERERGREMESRAPLTIGADGLRSTVARRLGLVRRRPRLRKLSLSAHVRIAGTPGSLGELYLADGACLGIAPVIEQGSLHNLTLVVDADRFGPEVRRNALAFFRRSLDRFPAVGSRLGAEVPVAPTPDRTSGAGRPDPESAAPRLLASGPFDWPMRRVVTDGAALVGDAAGYYDPFTGQGIFRALRGAELLAEVAGRALERGDVSARALRAYARRRARLIRGPVALQHAIEYVLSRPRAADRAIRLLGRRPEAANALVAVTGDLIPVRTLLSGRVLATFPPIHFRGRGRRDDDR